MTFIDWKEERGSERGVSACEGKGRWATGVKRAERLREAGRGREAERAREREGER